MATEVTAVSESCDNVEEIGRGTFPLEVSNSAPTDIVAELLDPASGWRESLDSAASDIPTFVEGSSIPVRSSARDFPTDQLTFAAQWRPGGEVDTRVRFFVQSPADPGDTTTYETELTAVDQHDVAPLILYVTDGQFTDGELADYWIVNAEPVIESLDTTADQFGNVGLQVRVSDPGNAQRDVERISIDWGDGSAPDDLEIEIEIEIETSFDGARPDVDVEGDETTIAVVIDDPDTDPTTLVVDVDWGDGTTSSATYDPTSEPPTFVARRTYATLGTYVVTVSAVDAGVDREEALLEGEITVPDRPVSATVEQGVGQLDPTSGSTVVFDVAFSESVTGFDADDVIVSGTAGASLANVVDSGDGMAFAVEVSGMTGTGTVTADVVAGAANNEDGVANLASSSSDNEVEYILPIVLQLPGIDGVVTVENEPGRAGAVVEFETSATGGVGVPRWCASRRRAACSQWASPRSRVQPPMGPAIRRRQSARSRCEHRTRPPGRCLRQRR